MLPISQEEKLELLPEFERKLAKNIATAGKTGELNFMMEGLTYFPMGVFQEEVGRDEEGWLVSDRRVGGLFYMGTWGISRAIFRRTTQCMDLTLCCALYLLLFAGPPFHLM